jgi:hypothetical protein
MSRWRRPKPNLISPSIRGALRVDQALWIMLRLVARCDPPLSVHRRSIPRSFRRGDVQPDRAGVRANGTRQIAARTVVWKWAFAGHRGSGYLMLSEMHARLKALLERMAKT